VRKNLLPYLALYSVIEDDTDLTISLISRNWVHATGEAEMGYFLVFLLMLIPRLGVREPSSHQPLFIIPSANHDPTLPVLRRILQTNEFISDFVQATASHLRRFRGFKAEAVASFLDKFWAWASAHKQDPLCAQFLRELRTSAPFWSNLFEASLKSVGHRSKKSFEGTLHHNMSVLAGRLVVTCDSPEDAQAVTKLLVSTCIFDALEASLEEVLCNGTKEDQFELCRAYSRTRVFLRYLIRL
jgi:hypothetical protein